MALADSNSQGELRSVHSTNLLRLLMTQKDTGLKTLTLEDFRASMEVPATYRYADIKRYAIVPAVKVQLGTHARRKRRRAPARGRLGEKPTSCLRHVSPRRSARQPQ